MNDTHSEAAENDRLVFLRGRLRDGAAAIAAAEADRIAVLAEACEIARARSARLTDGNSRDREMALRSIAAELGAALRMNDRAMQGRLNDAARMMDLFPATVDALRAARIDRAHADVILDAGYALTGHETRAQFELAVLEFAENDSPARTRVFAHRWAEHLHPRTIDERFAVAHDTRHVRVVDLDDGMSELTARLATTVAHAIADRLTRQAKELRRHDDADRRAHAAAQATTAGAVVPPGDTASPPFDDRTRDCTRADLFADTLLTGAPGVDPTGAMHPGGLGAIRAQVQITVPVTTLTGVTRGGAELDGRAPVDSETARFLSSHAPGWDRVMLDPVRGTVWEVDRYEPLTCQRRYLTARDVRCRMPGCRRPARDGQVDHTREWQDGGKTRIDNLAYLCVRHHTLKTETDWTVRQLPGGDLEWTSPLGFAYADTPPARVVFLPDSASPAHSAVPEIAPF